MELLCLIAGLLLLMVALRLLFSEMDGRAAARRMNLAYFLNFEKKFVYRRMGTTLFTIVICFLLFSGISITTRQGLLVLGIFIAIGMLGDFISSYIYHLYGKRRFKAKINEAKEYLASLKRRIAAKVEEDDIYVINSSYDFTEVAQRYVREDDHLACFSDDGGRWFSKLPRYSQVSFLVDGKISEANLRFADSPVRTITLTADGRYPFKDQKLDMLICYNENFKPQEASRVLKDHGLLVLNQLGSENLIELYAFSNPRLFRNQWNLNFLKEGLMNQNYDVLDSFEERGEIRFRSIAAFYQYVKEMTLLKIDQVEDFINQYFFIDQYIQKNGFFSMKTHRFYAVARKKGSLNQSI